MYQHLSQLIPRIRGVFVVIVGLMFGLLLSLLLLSQIQIKEVQKSYANPSLGLVIDKEFRVVHVEPEGNAALVGIQEKDILKQIDDIDVSTISREGFLEKWHQIVADKYGKPFSVVLQRGDKLLTIDITFKLSESRSGVEVLPTPTPVLSPFLYF